MSMLTHGPVKPNSIGVHCRYDIYRTVVSALVVTR